MSGCVSSSSTGSKGEILPESLETTGDSVDTSPLSSSGCTDKVTGGLANAAPSGSERGDMFRGDVIGGVGATVSDARGESSQVVLSSGVFLSGEEGSCVTSNGLWSMLCGRVRRAVVRDSMSISVTVPLSFNVPFNKSRT